MKRKKFNILNNGDTYIYKIKEVNWDCPLTGRYLIFNKIGDVDWLKPGEGPIFRVLLSKDSNFINNIEYLKEAE